MKVIKTFSLDIDTVNLIDRLAGLGSKSGIVTEAIEMLAKAKDQEPATSAKPAWAPKSQEELDREEDAIMEEIAAQRKRNLSCDDLF